MASISIGSQRPPLVKQEYLLGPAECLPFLAVYANGSEFVLRNGSVQLTLSHGRITSLVDVQQGYVRIEVCCGMDVDWFVF